MLKKYRVYQARLIVNGIEFQQVVIDPHYEKKHNHSINDDLILTLIKHLDGRFFYSEAISESGFEYFVTEPIFFKAKAYRLIWLIPPDKSFLGVRNAFRRNYEK